MEKKKSKVSMIVFNSFKNDARILKEAYTLMDIGYEVKVYALYAKDVMHNEIRNGLVIERIEINPLHKRFLAFILRKGRKKTTVSKVQKTKTNSSESLLKKEKTSAQIKIDNPQNKQKDSISFKIKDALYNTLKWILLAFHKPLTYYDFQAKVVAKIVKDPTYYYHCHDLNTLYAGYRASKKTKGKLIYDSHELFIERNKVKKPTKFYKFISKRFERYLIRRTDHVITVGECIAAHLSKQYKIPEPSVIMNAPSKVITKIGDKSLRNEIGIANDLKLAIYCGGITFNRGLEKLIESLTLMPKVFLVLMGYGNPEYLNKLQDIANKHLVSDRFSFYGPVAPTEVTAYTASADLGIAPIQNACLSYYYCAPNKVFEYLVGGIPVVASNFPELTKIVEENNIGETFDPENIKSISTAITNIFSDEKNYEKMKANTKIAANKYNWEIESKKLLDIYQSLK